MTGPFAHPSSNLLLGKVSDVFKEKTIFQRKDRRIVFVCGGPTRKRSRSMRYRFLKYAKKELPQFRFFLAEAATKDLIQHNEPEFINVADFETLVAEISDCIILFPESAGSIAEAGFFANSNKALKKLLIINDIDKQNDSFINIGLLDRINAKSNFRQIIWANFKNPDFAPIKERLNSRLSTKSSKKFQYDKFQGLTNNQRLFVIFQIVYFFKALKFESITHCLSTIFGKAQPKLVKHCLSILISVDYLKREGDDLEYFAPLLNVKPFLEFRNYDVRDIQAVITNFFIKNHQETYEIVKRLGI